MQRLIDKEIAMRTQALLDETERTDAGQDEVAAMENHLKKFMQQEGVNSIVFADDHPEAEPTTVLGAAPEGEALGKPSGPSEEPTAARATEKELTEAKILTRRQIVNHIKQPGDRISGKDGSMWEFIGRDESRKGSPNIYRRLEPTQL